MRAGLEPYTEYAVRLKASSSAGSSEWGPVAIIRTGQSVPSAPQNLFAEGADCHGRKGICFAAECMFAAGCIVKWKGQILIRACHIKHNLGTSC